jgi:hypothetical protein
LVFNVDQRIGCAKINRKIVGENAEKGIQHQQTPSTCSKKGLKHRENNRFGVFWQGNEKTKEKCRQRTPDGCNPGAFFLL